MIYAQIDSIYLHFSVSSNRKFELGETNYLEKITANAKHKQIQLQLQQVQAEKQIKNNAIALENRLHNLKQALQQEQKALG